MQPRSPVVVVAPGEPPRCGRVDGIIQVGGVKALPTVVHEEIDGQDRIDAHHQEQDT